MKKNEVEVGTVYRVKVSGSVQDVRITGENPHGGDRPLVRTTGRGAVGFARGADGLPLRSAAAAGRPSPRSKQTPRL